MNAVLTEKENPDAIRVYGYLIEMFPDSICIYDPKGTLNASGQEKLANWLVQEDIKQKPFKVKIYKGTH